jgi:hypothetical protein
MSAPFAYLAGPHVGSNGLATESEGQ